MAAISRLVRRVCLLREQGELSEADEVESTRLVELIHALRESSGPAAFTDQQLEGIYEVERERAANANALCEILIPLLQDAKSLPPRSAPIAREPVKVTIPSRPASPPDGIPGITDMLDAMLAAERTGRRVTQTNRQET